MKRQTRGFEMSRKQRKLRRKLRKSSRCLSEESSKFRLSDHHRKPKSVGGKTTARNISRIPINRHQSWHTLFDNKHPDEIAEIINDIYLDPDYEFVCIRRE
jgi:hypothetical protein